jgi:endo-1,4-beta-D-glucanase Y
MRSLAALVATSLFVMTSLAGAASGCSDSPSGASPGGPSPGGDSGSSDGGLQGDGAESEKDGSGPGPGVDAGPPVDRSFGSHTFHYPPDVLLPTGAQADLDAKTASAYDAWKGQYVKQGCGGYYVRSGGGTGTDVGDMVSEGHGYGMVITAIMAGHDPEARAVFDGMYAFFKKFPTTSHKDLMSWTVDVAGGCKIPTNQSDSATDGDLDIAYALLLADAQWPGAGYLDKAKAVIADIKSGDVHQTTHQPTLGDWASPGDKEYDATRPSDFMLDHFRAFGAATGDAVWAQSVDSIYQLIGTIQTKYSPSTGLLPDFVVTTTSAPAPAPPQFLEGNSDGDYFYNSCRVPWRIGTDYIVSKDPRAKAALQKINAWIMATTSHNPGAIVDGYTLAGGAIGHNGGSSPFTSPFAVAAMIGSDQAWLDKLWASRAIDQGYYGDSITMMDMIVLSGNWWAP